MGQKQRNTGTPTAHQLMQQRCIYAVLDSVTFKEVVNQDNGMIFFSEEQATACARRMNEGLPRECYQLGDYEDVLADFVADEDKAFATLLGERLLTRMNNE